LKQICSGEFDNWTRTSQIEPLVKWLVKNRKLIDEAIRRLVVGAPTDPADAWKKSDDDERPDVT
jgi:hypothetical protein